MSFPDPNPNLTPSSSHPKMPELLSPAGTFVSLPAGIQNGADAVYMGASKFGARAYAGNFSDFELAAGIDYAHAFGKKVYVTLNTLYKDEELDEVIALFDELYERGVDSVIVQDLGLLSRLYNLYPNFPIHASTQMTVHNSYHASFLKRYGVIRVVPARENSIPELIAIQNIGVEIETFIHGALCICYSGQCLFSSLVGSRSGNRGKCAQPCRKRYELFIDGKPVLSEGQYLLSPKDLNASENLVKLTEIGVNSFKIEGRMKKPEYVAGVVSVYRRLLDRIFSGSLDSENGKPTKDEKETLRKLFNRDFTDGYFLSNPKNNLMSRKLPYNKGILVGKILSVDRRKSQITVSLVSGLSAHDGISVGNIGKEMNSTEDPRRGFTVKKMYVGRSICSQARAGDIAEIPAAVLFDAASGSLPAVGDPVYKTFDFELYRTLSKTFIASENGEIEEIISDIFQKETAVFPSADSVYSSADEFPISELIEKLSPADSLKIQISFVCTLSVGSPILITVSDNAGHSASVRSEYIIESAQKNPFSNEQAADLLSKLGSGIYQISSADISITGDCFIPVGEFKNTRNKSLHALLNEIILSKRRISPMSASVSAASASIASASVTVPSASASALVSAVAETVPLPASPVVSVCVYSKNDLSAALNAGADKIYVGGDLYKDPITRSVYGLSVSDIVDAVSDLSADEKEKIWFKTPFVIKEEDFKVLDQTFRFLKEAGISGILVSNIGVFEFLLSDSDFQSSFKFAADFSFNIFNSDAAALIFESGACAAALSQELSISDISSLIRHYPLKNKSGTLPEFECMIYGRQRLMVTEHPLLESVLDGRTANETGASLSIDSASVSSSDSSSVPLSRFIFKDSKNYMFPVFEDSKGRGVVFNSKELNALDLAPKLYRAGVSIFRIDGIGYSSEEIAGIVSKCKRKLFDFSLDSASGELSNDGARFTKGNFIRGVD
jgi:Collagenase and related proteases